MPMDLGTRNTLLCDFMHCMTAVSLEMSDEPKKRPKISCNPFIYYSFEQKLFDDKKFAFIAVLIAPLKK